MTEARAALGIACLKRLKDERRMTVILTISNITLQVSDEQLNAIDVTS